ARVTIVISSLLNRYGHHASCAFCIPDSSSHTEITEITERALHFLSVPSVSSWSKSWNGCSLCGLVRHARQLERAHNPGLATQAGRHDVVAHPVAQRGARDVAVVEAHQVAAHAVKQVRLTRHPPSHDDALRRE